jgi:hypothetical protein
MVWSNKKFGTMGISLQALAIIPFCLLLVTEKLGLSQTIDKPLLWLSVRLILASAPIVVIGMIVDKKPVLAVIAVLLTVPILALMAGLQGIW